MAEDQNNTTFNKGELQSAISATSALTTESINQFQSSDNDSECEANNSPSYSDAKIQEKANSKSKTPKANEKMPKLKPKKSRELNKLEDSQIIHSRLRSESGKVYSSSVTVDPNTATADTQLGALQEEQVADECTMDCCKKSDQIISMITKLQSSIDDITTKFQTQESQQLVTATRVSDIEQKIVDQNQTTDDLQEELSDTKFQLKLVTNIVAKQEQQINILTRKMTEMQQREMQSNIIITGIVETKNEKPVQLFNQFVQEQLELQELIPANKAYRIGSGKTRPLLVELRHTDHKGKLFAKASNLKGKKNASGGFFFLSDHLPDELNEARRRKNQLFAENKKKPAGYKLDMEFRRGELVINQLPYEKAVQVPSAKEIINPSASMYEAVEEIHIVKGEEEFQGNSTFVSFAAAVEDVADINAAYLKLKMKYADASHISCAYRLPGANTPINQDFVDDGEHGCGRTILREISNEGLMNVAVFIMRYYGGKHLGAKRFDIFRDLTTAALKNLVEQRKERGESDLAPVPDHLKVPSAPDADLGTDSDWTTVNHSSKKRN